nr:A14 [uncultured bacterium]
MLKRPIVETAAIRSSVPATVAKVQFQIKEMDCPAEEKLIRDRFKGMPEIDALEFNLIGQRLSVTHHSPSIDSIVTALKSLNMTPVVVEDTLATKAEAQPVDQSGVHRSSRKEWVLLAISGASAIASEVVAWTMQSEVAWPVIALAVSAIVTGGLDTLKKGLLAIRHLSLNMNFLMSIAVLGAAAIGQWPEAAVVIFLFTVAEKLEAFSMDRARNAIQGLMAMAPEMATVRDVTGDWRAFPAKEVKVGAIVRVAPGERVPLDGVVLTGQTTINQAPITGESIPVAKQPGDSVFAGTINERAGFDYTVTVVQGHSTLARIMAAVQEAQSQRAPTQRFVDEFARYYIPVVFLIALLVALFPPLLFGATFSPWLYKALVLLVIACPCALVLSTPVTVVSGLAAAARRGILIKGGVYLELGRKLKAIALDKTGTLTRGKPIVTDTRSINIGDQKPLLRLAGSLAGRSDHPVSGAVLAHVTEADRDMRLADVGDFEALTGRGVKGRIDGEMYYLGNHRLVEELAICGPPLEAQLEALERDGKTAVVLCSATAPLLILAVADTVRTTSIEAIEEIRSLGIDSILLTGDNPHTATAIGNQVGISDARGNLLPEDKLAAIQEMRARYGTVGMVGDGINDAPALAKADIGFAMGAAGTDTAIETADVALMDDDLRKIPDFVRLSRRTYSILWLNITIALGTKLVFFVLALTGQATLWMAVFADLGATLIVIANGLRLLRGTPNTPSLTAGAP